MSRKAKAAVLILTALVTTVAVSFISMVAIAGNTSEIFPGVTVQGLALGKMTKEEAARELASYSEHLKIKPIAVKFHNGSNSFLLSEVNFQVQAATTAEKAWLIGRRGNFLEQWQERRKVGQRGTEVPLGFSFSNDRLREILDRISQEVRVPPKDARLVITPEETIEIVESTTGLGVNYDDARNQLQGIIQDDLTPEITLRLVELAPGQTTEDLEKMRVNGVLAKYSTRFNLQLTNRVYNIKVAASALDGQMIKPGEAFSFNRIVGPRSEDAGYKMAKTILNNEFIDGLGGGVCQVSSTLYNTLLQADLEIIERSSHSLVITYVPLGQDASVVYDRKDLKFKNNLPCTLVIKSAVVGDSLTFWLLGDTSLRKSIKIINSIIKDYPFKIVYKDDPTLPEGKQVVQQKGNKGYLVTSSMIIYQEGMLIGKKTLPSSSYKPLDQVILVGTGPAAADPVSSDQTGGEPGQPGTPEPTAPVENEPAQTPAPSTPTPPVP